MERYDELRMAFAKFSDEQSDYRTRLAQFAYGFAAGFRAYLGAPESYVGSDGVRHPYFVLCKLLGEPYGNQFELEDANLLEALTDQNDGSLTFGFRIVLERKAEAFPKLRYGFAAVLHPTGEDACQLQIAGDKFDVSLSNKDDRVKVYDHLLAALRKWLAAKPWDDMQTKRPIGFVSYEI